MAARWRGEGTKLLASEPETPDAPTAPATPAVAAASEAAPAELPSGDGGETVVVG